MSMARLSAQAWAALGGTLVLLAACASGQKPAAPITDREWVLAALGDRTAPTGAGNRPATLRFDSATSRASGFAGCNRYSATYTLAANTLRFGPAVSTKMACAEGDELERSFLAIFPAVAGYEATDSVLTLDGQSGPLARFHSR